MVENQLFSSYSGLVDEVYGLYDNESFYYNAPQLPSYNRGDLFYCQAEFVYNPAFYVMPSYLVYYPEMPVLYSTDFYYLTDFVTVYSGYCMPYYYEPSNLYYVNDIYQVPSYETTWVSSPVEQDSFAYEEYDCGLFSPDNGFYNDSYESFEEVVGEASTTSHFFYEESPEKLNDGPNDDEVKSNSSNNTVKNDVVSNTPDKDESLAVEPHDRVQTCTINKNPIEEDEYKKFIDSLSAADMMELKAEIDGTYENLKKNLYNDVIRGYVNMKEFLKNVKWKWDRLLPTIREEEKFKKTFDDMEQYYFHDVIRIPKGRVRYEDPAEKYILYQLLGSLEMPTLKRFMKKNYNKGKRRLYKDECKGHTKIKKQLKKLKWKRSTLCPITDGEELKITEEAFVQNFIKGLRNITSEKSSDVNYLLDVLKKSVLTSTPESEEIEADFNEEVTALDCELMIENSELPVSSTDSVEDRIPDTPHISLSNGKLDVKSQNIIEDFQLADSSSYIAEDIKSDPDPQKTELSLSEEDSESEKIEENHTSLSSLEKIGENERPFVPPVIEMDSFCKEDSGDEIIKENRASISSPEKVEEKEHPFAPPVMELDSVSYVSFREEELNVVSMSNTEETNLDVPSPDKVPEKKFPPPPAILESEASAAAAENKHPKKRFSSLRKFLSRICCCRKKPPS